MHGESKGIYAIKIVYAIMIEAILTALGNRKAVYQNEDEAKAHIADIFPGAIFGQWTQSEEPDAKENEWVCWATVDGEPVAALYEEA
jgi:hypothetical protein